MLNALVSGDTFNDDTNQLPKKKKKRENKNVNKGKMSEAKKRGEKEKKEKRKVPWCSVQRIHIQLHQMVSNLKPPVRIKGLTMMQWGIISNARSFLKQ